MSVHLVVTASVREKGTVLEYCGEKFPVIPKATYWRKNDKEHRVDVHCQQSGNEGIDRYQTIFLLHLKNGSNIQQCIENFQRKNYAQPFPFYITSIKPIDNQDHTSIEFQIDNKSGVLPFTTFVAPLFQDIEIAKPKEESDSSTVTLICKSRQTDKINALFQGVFDACMAKGFNPGLIEALTNLKDPQFFVKTSPKGDVVCDSKWAFQHLRTFRLLSGNINGIYVFELIPLDEQTRIKAQASQRHIIEWMDKHPQRNFVKWFSRQWEGRTSCKMSLHTEPLKKLALKGMEVDQATTLFLVSITLKHLSEMKKQIEEVETSLCEVVHSALDLKPPQNHPDESKDSSEPDDMDLPSIIETE
jgi:hypothetical protein